MKLHGCLFLLFLLVNSLYAYDPTKKVTLDDITELGEFDFHKIPKLDFKMAFRLRCERILEAAALFQKLTSPQSKVVAKLLGDLLKEAVDKDDAEKILWGKIDLLLSGSETTSMDFGAMIGKAGTKDSSIPLKFLRLFQKRQMEMGTFDNLSSCFGGMIGEFTKDFPAYAMNGYHFRIALGQALANQSFVWESLVRDLERNHQNERGYERYFSRLCHLLQQTDLVGMKQAEYDLILEKVKAVLEARVTAKYRDTNPYYDAAIVLFKFGVPNDESFLAMKEILGIGGSSTMRRLFHAQAAEMVLQEHIHVDRERESGTVRIPALCAAVRKLVAAQKDAN